MGNELEKKYGLPTAICMVVGIVIGSGVFFKAESVLVQTGGNMPLGILAWLIVGAIMIVCSYVFATMATRYGKVNGLVDYAEATVGDRYAYLMGWFVAAIAGVAYAIHKNGEGVRKAFEQGWLRGLLQIFLSVMDGLNELVATLTGVDLYSIGGQWIDGLLRGIKQGWQQLMGWLDKGLDSIAGIFRSDDDGKGTASGAATSTLPMADPLNMVPGAKSMMQLARSERVIRQENTVRIIAPEGMRLEGEGQGRGLDVRGDVAEAGVLNAGAI